LIAIFLLVTTFYLKGQSYELSSNSELNLQTFSYPIFFGNEQHKELILNLALTENLHVEMQGFYDTYILENRLRSSIALKKNLNNGFYGLIGVGVEWRKGLGMAPINKPSRFAFNAGLGYNIEDFLYIDAKGSFALKKDAMGAFGEPFISMPQVYTLSSKVKF